MPLRCSSKLILTPSSWLRKKNHFEEAAGKPTVTFPICASWQGRRIREWKLTDVNQLIKDQTNVVGWRGGEMEHLISSPGYCVLIKFHYWLIFGTICVMIYVKFDKCVTYSDTFFYINFLGVDLKMNIQNVFRIPWQYWKCLDVTWSYGRSYGCV